MATKEITNSIYYIGADDKELDLFEGQYSIPDGISYNSYVVMDEKVAVVDTIDPRTTSQWIENLTEVLNGRTPDYLIVQHMEPDHAGNVKLLLERYPTMCVVCTAPAMKLIARFFGVALEANQVKVVKDGDTLNLGTHVLHFATAPMVHWPEVMVTYDETAKVLFSADAFGKFGALNGTIIAQGTDGWACEARRYYFNICGKYGLQVQQALRKVSALDIQTICPAHGPVLCSELNFYIGLYDTWSSYRPESEGVFIAYCSLHGNTQEAALKLAEIIRAEGSTKISVSDLRRDDMAEAVEDAFRYDRLVLAAPTYDGGVMPIMEDFLNHLKNKKFQNRRVGIIENGSWTPQAAKVMSQALEAMKDIKIVNPIVTVESTVKDNTIIQLKALANALINE